MSATSSFRTVLRGYEPAQVDERVGELVADLHASQDRVAELTRQVEALQRDLAEGRTAAPQPPPVPQGASAYTALGARIGQVLALAEEEAAELVATAREHADRLVAEAQEQADLVREECARQLTAAAQRRDSINAQLADVRQVLTSLTGPVPVVDLHAARGSAVQVG